VILGMGRAVGETMAVVMVAGNAVQLPHSPLDPVRTLTANLALEMGYAAGDHRAALFATGIVLFLVIVILNGVAGLARARRPQPRARHSAAAVHSAALRSPTPDSVAAHAVGSHSAAQQAASASTAAASAGDPASSRLRSSR
jgi:phosphate transport system permease protein